MEKHKKAPKRKAEELTKIRRKMRRLESKLRKYERSSDLDTSTSSVDSSVDSEQENGSSSIDGENRDIMIFGDDPFCEKTYGPEIYGSLATKWNNYLQNSIEKELKSKLFDNKQIPNNCLFLEDPTLNPEVQAMISAKDAKKNAFTMELQNQLGKGTSALGTVIDDSRREHRNKSRESISKINKPCRGRENAMHCSPCYDQL
nr:unnamed protein product [Callosobruchus analis]